jgi:hypothetical protein
MKYSISDIKEKYILFFGKVDFSWGKQYHKKVRKKGEIL